MLQPEEEGDTKRDASIRRCAVIGAGPSGLAVAKALLDEARDWAAAELSADARPRHLEVVIFEQTDQVGGNWVYREPDDPYFHASACYASLRTNTAKSATAFSDMPMPASYPINPHHEQVASYLRSYAEQFHILPHIRFHTKVIEVEPLADISTPLVSLPSPSSSSAPQPAQSTLLSSILSIFKSGSLPKDRGHARQFTDGEPAPRVLEYGRPLGTNTTRFHPDDPRTPRWRLTSSCKGEQVTEEFDAVAVCNGHHWDPIPPPFEAAECTAELMHSHEYRDPAFCTGKRVAVVGLGTSGMEITEEVLQVCSKLISCSQRWEEYASRVQSIDTLKQFFPFLNDSRSVMKGVPTRVSGTTLHFADGSKEEADIVICCTGYRLKFPFLNEHLISTRCLSIAHPTSQYLPLYRFIFLPHVLSIAFIAVMNVNGSLHPVADAQGKLFAQFVAGKIRLPSEEHMVDNVQRWFELVYKSKRVYRVMEVDPTAYLGLLAHTGLPGL